MHCNSRRESAESLLSLVLGDEATGKSISPFSRYFTRRQQEAAPEIGEVLEKCYARAVVNADVFQRVLRAAEAPERETALLEILEEIRGKETAHILGRYLSSFENATLHSILQDCVEQMKTLQQGVDEAFSRLESQFKSRLLESLHVSFDRITHLAHRR